MNCNKCYTDEMIKQMMESDKTELQDIMNKAVTDTTTSVVVSTQFKNRPDVICVDEVKDTLKIPSRVVTTKHRLDVCEDEETQTRSKLLLGHSVKVNLFIANAIAMHPKAIILKYRVLKSGGKSLNMT